MWKPIIFLILLCWGCTTAQQVICPCDAPEQILLDNHMLTFSAEAVIDNQSAKPSITLSVTLFTLDKTSFPEGATIGEFYIRSTVPSREAYRGRFVNLAIDREAGVAVCTAQNLPAKWVLGEQIDIAVGLIGPNGVIQFIKKEKITIR